MTNHTAFKPKSGSFAEWLDARERGLDLDCDTAAKRLYPTQASQEDISWRAQAIEYTPNPLNPQWWEEDTRTCRWLMMRDRRRDILDIEEETWTYLPVYECVTDYEIEELEDAADTLWPLSPAKQLEKRIEEIFPMREWTRKRLSKKRREQDQRPRNTQRDQSPRGKVYRDVDKAHNRTLARQDRRSARTMVGLVGDEHAMNNHTVRTQRRVPNGWDCGTPTHSRQV